MRAGLNAAFVYEIPLMELSKSARAALVVEMLRAFGMLAPRAAPPPPHLLPLRFWGASLVTFVNLWDEDLAARALLLAPGAARLPSDLLYIDKLWSARAGRGAGKTLMNALAMMAEEEGRQLRWRARDPGFYRRWAQSRTAGPPLRLRALNDRDYVHFGLDTPRRCWEAEDLGWLRMPSAWETW